MGRFYRWIILRWRTMTVPGLKLDWWYEFGTRMRFSWLRERRVYRKGRNRWRSQQVPPDCHIACTSGQWCLLQSGQNRCWSSIQSAGIHLEWWESVLSQHWVRNFQHPRGSLLWPKLQSWKWCQLSNRWNNPTRYFPINSWKFIIKVGRNQSN